MCVDQVDWFNDRDLIGPICNIMPAEAEERYDAMIAQFAMAAWLNRQCLGNPGAVQSSYRSSRSFGQERVCYGHKIVRYQQDC